MLDRWTQMRKLTRLWQSLEKIPGLAQVPAAWEVYCRPDPATRISCCFSSSRLKMMSFFGWYSFSIVSVNFLPKEPVPPVTRTVRSDHGMCLSTLR